MSSMILFSQTRFEEINEEISSGNFTKAEEMINNKIKDKTISDTEKWDLNFQIDKMERIRLDFRKTREEIKTAIKKYYHDISEEQIDMWEKQKHLEMRIIDGEKRYFKNAVANLFRVNKEAAKLKIEKDGEEIRELDSFLSGHLPASIDKIKISNNVVGNPVKITIDYSLKVDADAVPEGEIIRCWLPYPKEHNRQTDIKIISANPNNYIIADNKYPHRTLYMEKAAEKGEKTEFNILFEYRSWSEWHKIDPASILAKKIFTWINDNIPWASALEYSTIDSISSYCYKNMHGDCGIKTLLFMTLARMNGIPAKWQSGWMLHPPEVNLHDWCEIYLEGYGWVPVDQSFGIQESDDENVSYFYLGGIDSYRLIVNDDYSKDLYPAKIFPGAKQ
jgi:hypothetical protein